MARWILLAACLLALHSRCFANRHSKTEIDLNLTIHQINCTPVGPTIDWMRGPGRDSEDACLEKISISEFRLRRIVRTAGLQMLGTANSGQ
jgi:hypothetical protein